MSRGPARAASRRLAVALRYDGAAAPRVTAKGHGEVADKIVETARAHDVPVEENAALAQALSGLELDEEIPVELYQAVAQVIGFVLGLRRRAGSRGSTVSGSTVP
jgi:flagellar biosynthesis protein